jgi:tRNA-specific 2-thiouridylase
VVVGPREALLVEQLRAVRPIWCGPVPSVGDRVAAQVRAHGEELPGRIVALDAGQVTVRLDGPASGVAAGQTLVLYSGTRVLGSGTLLR